MDLHYIYIFSKVADGSSDNEYQYVLNQKSKYNRNQRQNTIQK